MDVSFHHNEQLVRPWRMAAFVAAAIAAVELLVLIVVGGALIAKASTATSAKPAQKAAVAKSAAVKSGTSSSGTTVRRTAIPAAHLPRTRVSVVVLNGGSRQGAAAATAARATRRGYRIGGVANAPSSDFTRTLVMYRRGFEGEGRRLARDLGIKIVGPLDGLRVAQLHGSHAIVVLGS
ncbi:MAG: LytR C-terminal domain-containing protein [Thermoleophilia bacterium]|nr:LytR C-terminal domain-containing protein [Thermoleophilia bacterium]